MKEAALLFGAQGTQWPTMAADLLRDEPVFAQAIAECEREIEKRAGWSLSRELSAPRAAYRAHEHPRVVQPALTSVQIALAHLLRSAGVAPTAAGALSMGEAAAAWCCGAIGVGDAIEVAWRTALLTEHELAPGRMAFLRTSWEVAGELIAPFRDDVALAVELGLDVSVISGEPGAVDAVLRAAAARAIPGGGLPLAQAYHSPAVQGIGAQFRQGLRGLRPQATRIPLYSSARRGVQRGEELSPEHWWLICSGPSYFCSIARQMIADGHRRFIEVSPHPMLAGSLRDIARELEIDVDVVTLMDRQRGASGWRAAIGAEDR